MISVVVPTHNRKALLENCLESLIKQKHKDYEIIVVDDGSTDGTALLVKNLQRKSGGIIYLRQENRGHSLARNLGLSKARGDIIVSTDDDCTSEPEWLEKIEDAFRKYPGIAAAGGSIANPTDTRIAWSHYILGYSDWSPGMRKRFVRNIPTCNIAYSRESITGLEFEDDRKSLGYRDSLFNLNVSELGKILFDPEIRTNHHKRITSLQDFLSAQRRQALGFYHGGHRAHRAGCLLRFLWPINILCPRLFLVFYRCLKSGLTRKFISNLPLILRGEMERFWCKHERN
jgi:glycosyltransferase involved in cell wall biosynthesis